MTPEGYLEDRLKEMEQTFEGLAMGPWSQVQYLIKQMRNTLEMHKHWPVLVEGPEKFEEDPNGIITGSWAMRISRQMEWMTQQQYREKFGTEPPTAPLIKEMLAPFRYRPDFNQEWLA